MLATLSCDVNSCLAKDLLSRSLFFRFLIIIIITIIIIIYALFKFPNVQWAGPRFMKRSSAKITSRIVLLTTTGLFNALNP